MNTQNIEALLDPNASPSKAKYLGEINYHDTKIAQFYNPDLIFNDIYTENRVKNFTSILNIGTPGSGKTTLATTLAHNIEIKGGYEVRWYGKNDIINLDVVLDELPQGKNMILIFDDVSLALKRIKNPEKRIDVLESLTTARHPKMGADRNIISIANIHYLYGLDRMWRAQGQWKIFTDLSREEMQNFNALTDGHFSTEASNFGKIARDMMRKETFNVRLTNKRFQTYTTNKPTRFAMVYDSDRPRFMHYAKEGCDGCLKTNLDHRTIMDTHNLINVITDKFEYQGLSALRMMAWIKGQREHMQKKMIYALDDMIRMDGIYQINWPDVSTNLRSRANMKEKRDYRKKGDSEDTERRILETKTLSETT